MSFAKFDNIVDFLIDLGIIEVVDDKVIVPDDVYTSTDDGNSYTRKPFSAEFLGDTVEKVKEFVKDNVETLPQIFKKVRYGLSHHQPNLRTLSLTTFTKTKIFALVDIDEDIPEAIVFERAFNLKMPPVYIKKTFKGWHLIYVSNDYFTKDEASLLEALSSFVFSQVREMFKDVKKIEKKNPMLAETRITLPSLPAYKIRDFYDKDELLSLKDTVSRQDQYIDISQITLKDIETVYNICYVLQKLDVIWKYHTYNEWYLMSYYYALRYIKGDEFAYQSFIQKSSQYEGFNIKEAEEQFFNTLKWIQNQTETKSNYLFSCNSIQERCQNIDINETCKLCKAFPHPFIFAKQKFSLLPEGYVLEDNIIYKVVPPKKEDEAYIRKPICYDITITDIIESVRGSQQTYFIKLVNFLGETGLFELAYTTTGNLDISNLMHFINIIPQTPPREVAELIQGMVATYKQTFRTIKKVKYLGYHCFFNQRLEIFENSIIVANSEISKFDRKDLLKIFYNINHTDVDIPFPEVSGNESLWIEAWKKLTLTKDPLLLVLVGFSLLQLNHTFFKSFTPFTPVLFVRAVKGSGKTIRLLTTYSLFGYPAVFHFTSTTKAKIQNYFGLYKFPIYFDEVVLDKGSKNTDEVKQLIYAIANADIKSDAYKTATPITSPTVFSGEIQNFPVEPLLTGGITRRAIVVDIDKSVYQENTRKIVDVFKRYLRRNYGYIYKYITLFQNTQELERLFEYYRDKLTKTAEFDVELFDAAATILVNIKLFTEKLLGIDFQSFEDELIKFLIDRISSFITFIDEELLYNSEYEKVKAIQDKVRSYIATKYNDKIPTSKYLNDLIKEANISFSASDKDLKTLWSLLVGRAYYYKNRDTYVITTYSTNLFDSIFYTQNPAYSPDFIIPKEYERIKAIYKAMQHNKQIASLKDRFVKMYMSMLLDVMSLYPNQRDKIENYTMSLSSLGLLTEADVKALLSDMSVEDVIVKNQNVTLTEEDEAVEF